MELYAILTVQISVRNGFATDTVRGAYTIPPGSPTAGLLDYMLSQMPEQYRGGNILCFSVNPARLGES